MTLSFERGDDLIITVVMLAIDLSLVKFFLNLKDSHFLSLNEASFSIAHCHPRGDFLLLLFDD